VITILGPVASGSVYPKNIDDETKAALSEVANRYGLQPDAIAGVIKMESGWDTKSDNGVYRGLTQIGEETFREAGGTLGGMTYAQFRAASPAEQIRVYGAWLEHYKFKEQADKYGIDFSKMTKAQQAAYLQGMQFSPNGQDWKRAYAQGNPNVPTTTTRQAAALGNKTIGAMEHYYSGELKDEPTPTPNTKNNMATVTTSQDFVKSLQDKADTKPLPSDKGQEPVLLRRPISHPRPLLSPMMIMLPLRSDRSVSNSPLG
jgi:hypothetical protein